MRAVLFKVSLVLALLLSLTLALVPAQADCRARVVVRQRVAVVKEVVAVKAIVATEYLPITVAAYGASYAPDGGELARLREEIQALREQLQSAQPARLPLQDEPPHAKMMRTRCALKVTR